MTQKNLWQGQVFLATASWVKLPHSPGPPSPEHGTFPSIRYAVPMIDSLRYSTHVAETAHLLANKNHAA